MSKSHAEILAGIAAQVVEQHRKYTLTRGGFTTEQDKGNVPVPDSTPVCAWCNGLGHTAETGSKGICPPVDPSWDWTLPEEYRG